MRNAIRRILNRISSVRTPIGSISLDPEAEFDTAFRVISYFEDRRSLTGPFYPPPKDLVLLTQNPDHCIASISGIRVFLSEELAKLNRNSSLRSSLIGLGECARNFLSRVDEYPGHIAGSLDAYVSGALLEFRNTVKPHLKRIVDDYNIDYSQKFDYFLTNQISPLMPPDYD